MADLYSASCFHLGIDIPSDPSAEVVLSLPVLRLPSYGRHVALYRAVLGLFRNIPSAAAGHLDARIHFTSHATPTFINFRLRKYLPLPHLELSRFLQ